MKSWREWPPVVWVDETWHDFVKRCQRFRRGWATEDALYFDYWFSRVVPEMLDKLASETRAAPDTPENMSEDDWVLKLCELADEAADLNSLDWHFTKEDGRIDWDRAEEDLDERIYQFFAKFAKYFKHLNW